MHAQVYAVAGKLRQEKEQQWLSGRKEAEVAYTARSLRIIA
jgi:hypothetical protein